MAKPKSIVLNKEIQETIVVYLQQILQYRRKFTDFTTKLAAMDVAYAAHRIKSTTEISMDGLDVDAILQDTISKTDDVTIPLVASQVDSTVAYLAEVFLSGSPLFPVSSTADNEDLAMRFEDVVQFHSVKGKYINNLVKVFLDLAKYNFGAIDPQWVQTPPFIPSSVDLGEFALLASKNSQFNYTKLHRLDPYNTLWDYRVDPSEVETEGDFVGEIKLITSIKLKEMLNKLSDAKVHMNVNSAIASKFDTATVGGQVNPGIAQYISPNYIEKPQISSFVNSNAKFNSASWEAWLQGRSESKATPRLYSNYSNLYEVAVIYAKIIPSEFGIGRAQNITNINSPQVWEFWLLNGNILIYAQPKITAYGTLPVKVGSLLDDGFSYQTKSIAERVEPFQTAASDLYHIRINSAKRALTDREIYDPRHINKLDINSKSVTAKIPATGLGLNKSLSETVLPLPFNDSGTSSALQDMQATLQTSYLLTGLNPFKQGQTQKGNRTKEEFTSIINFSDLRSRLLALTIETQFMTPIKDQLRLNYILHTDQITGFSLRTGKDVSIKPEELIQTLIEFQISDGYTPRSKQMDTEDLRIAFEFMIQSRAEFGDFDVAKLFTHLMTLRGVKDLDQYKFSQEQESALLAKAIPLIQKMQAQQAQQAIPNAGGSNGNQ